MTTRESFDAKLEEIRAAREHEPTDEERDDHAARSLIQKLNSFAVYSAMVGAS